MELYAGMDDFFVMGEPVILGVDMEMECNGNVLRTGSFQYGDIN